MAKKRKIRRKPSIRLESRKGVIKIIETFYDDLGKVIKQSVKEIK
jgi:hypothetical protein